MLFLSSGAPLADGICGIGIKRTKLRLVRCRASMEMPTHERLHDARADNNLDDFFFFLILLIFRSMDLRQKPVGRSRLHEVKKRGGFFKRKTSGRCCRAWVPGPF
jgi:hypothetical protein